MLTLFVVIEGYLPRLGGAQKNVQAIGRTLSRNGYQVTVLTRRLPQTSKRENLDGVDIRRCGHFPIRIFSKLIYALCVVLVLVRQRKSCDAILVAPVFYWPDLLPAYIASRLTRLPLIVRTTMAGSLDYMLGAEKATGAERVKQIVFPPWLWRRVLDGATVITTQSMPIQERAKQLGLLNATMVYNGVDTEQFVPVSAEKRYRLRTQLNLPLDKTIVISTGRFVPKKNLIALSKAAAYLDNDVLFLILGASQNSTQSTANRTELENDIAANGLEHRVSVFENVVDVASYLQASDIFVLPSMFDEGMSNSVLEAMACGLPTICSAIPQLIAMFPDDLGRFFNPNDSAELAQAIQDLLDSAETRSYLSTELAQLARTRYSIQQSAKQYDALIRNHLPIPPIP